MFGDLDPGPFRDSRCPGPFRDSRCVGSRREIYSRTREPRQQLQGFLPQGGFKARQGAERP
eukprot:306739-Pyramimonas_sp.AAC.1